VTCEERTTPAEADGRGKVEQGFMVVARLLAKRVGFF